VKNRAVFWLKLAFIAGAVVDALAVIPMAVPWAAKLFWGFDDFTGIYYFAMGMGASLMLAWTILLFWAYRKPVERRYIALFTVIIIAGIVITQVVMIGQGFVQPGKFTGSFIMQAVLLALFSYGFIISRTETRN
jgi:hypothetical protein